jgi:hypothetical protein
VAEYTLQKERMMKTLARAEVLLINDSEAGNSFGGGLMGYLDQLGSHDPGELIQFHGEEVRRRSIGEGRALEPPRRE